jgi:hypothetical protein
MRRSEPHDQTIRQHDAEVRTIGIRVPGSRIQAWDDPDAGSRDRIVMGGDRNRTFGRWIQPFGGWCRLKCFWVWPFGGWCRLKCFWVRPFGGWCRLK